MSYEPEAPKLEPCPFCGGKAYFDELQEWPWARHEYMVKCLICGVHGPGRWTTDKSEAAQAWNMRK